MQIHLPLVATIFNFNLLSFALTSVPSLEDVLADTENLSSFRDLLTAEFSELVAKLSSHHQAEKYVTLLAPSDAAFERVGGSSIFADNSTEALQSFLNYHIIPGDHQQSTVNQSFAFFSTRLDNLIYTNVTDGQRLGLVKQGNGEVIVVSGGGTRSSVVQGDIYFSGGVMHVIGSPVLPPQPLVPAAIPFNLTGFLGAGYQDGSFDQFISQARDTTMFVPNNVAFEKVGSTVTSIDEQSLSSLLDYHIIVGQGGPFYSSSFQNGTVYTTLQGQNITIRQASNSNFVNSARLLQTDLLIANGVIHVIDNVLNPNGTGALPDPAVGPQAPAMTGTSLADTPFASIIPSLISMISIRSMSTGMETAMGSNAVGSVNTRRASPTRNSSTSPSTTSGVSPRIAGDGLRLAMAFGTTIFCICL